MTLELTTSWVVRGGCETSAEIAKYRLKGILHLDRQKCPAWRWAIIGHQRRFTTTGTIRQWFYKPIYRWERRK